MKQNTIFGNELSRKAVRKAEKSKRKYQKKFGDDSAVHYSLAVEENDSIGDILGVQNIVIQNHETQNHEVQNHEIKKEQDQINMRADERNNGLLDMNPGNSVIVGNIRMGFGHYRISMAIASAAHAMGYTPYWMDLNSYQETTGGKVINAQNELYSLGSRISGKSRLFNHFVWEPMNYEGFRKLSYNLADQKNAELMTSVYEDLPKDIPYVATHVWPAQAAVHAGMTSVVNAIPDNWPMALHLSEGSLHTVQTHSAYLGYRILNGMDQEKVLQPIPEDDIAYTGHYIDHELVSNIDADCDARIRRAQEDRPLRYLLTIGGAGAQKEIFAAIIRHLLPKVQEKKAVLYLNVGDYKNVWEELVREIPELTEATCYFDKWEETKAFVKRAVQSNTEEKEEAQVQGVYAFYHKNIFQAVYTTNLLMRSTDVLVTKPSELAFYPIPKLFIKRVGGHEQWGAVHSAEIGDGTLECRDVPHTLQMIDLFQNSRSLLVQMSEQIKRNHEQEIYSGAYKVVELAVKRSQENRTKI